jgi:phage gpG-like protein
MKSKIVKLDMTGLTKFMKGINQLSKFRVAVGIMGNKTNRTESKGKTNADIGVIHEFGQGKIPKRSFLRYPMFHESEAILREVQAKGALKNIQHGNFLQFLVDIGTACEAAVLRGFDTSGFGSWRNKKDGSPSYLIDTGDLRRSISSAVIGAQ